MVPANGPREMSALRLRANVAFWRIRDLAGRYRPHEGLCRVVGGPQALLETLTASGRNRPSSCVQQSLHSTAWRPLSHRGTLGSVRRPRPIRNIRYPLQRRSCCRSERPRGWRQPHQPQNRLYALRPRRPATHRRRIARSSGLAFPWELLGFDQQKCGRSRPLRTTRIVR